MKKAFRKLRVPVCGRFYPNEGGVSGYGNRMRVKYTAKWGLQIAEMIFQTRSSLFCTFSERSGAFSVSAILLCREKYGNVSGKHQKEERIPLVNEREISRKNLRIT